MRRLLIVVAALVALAALPATAVASSGSGPGGPGPIICDNCGGGTGGWTGCTSQRADHSASVWLLASVDHYLIVNYCKRNGWITSVSIAVHGCDARGIASCSTGPAWMTGGGVGWGYATFEAHANWLIYTTPFINNSDTLTLTIPIG
jgi:hypothetical protein